MNLFSFYEKIAIFLFFRFNFPTVPIFFPRYWIFFRGLKFFLRCPIYALWVRTIIWMKFSIQKEKKIFFLNIHQKSLKIRKLGLEPRPNFWEFFYGQIFFSKSPIEHVQKVSGDFETGWWSGCPDLSWNCSPPKKRKWRPMN